MLSPLLAAYGACTAKAANRYVHEYTFAPPAHKKNSAGCKKYNQPALCITRPKMLNALWRVQQCKPGHLPIHGRNGLHHDDIKKLACMS